MIVHKSARIATVDTHRAEEFLGMVDEDLQRELSSRHVAKMAYLMDHDRFLTGHIVTATIKDERRTFLANGRHQCTAIIETGRSQRCLTEEYDCTTRADYAELFNAFDTELRVRTLRDSAKAHLMARDTTDESHVDLNLFRGGVELYEYYMRDGAALTQAQTRYDRFRKVDEYKPEYALFREVRGNQTIRAMQVPTVASLIAMYRRHPWLTRQFWLETAMGFYSIQSKQYAPFKLHHFISNSTCVGGTKSLQSTGQTQRGRRPGDNVPRTALDIYVACARAWNYYIAIRELNVFRTYIGKAVRDVPFDVPTPQNAESLRDAAITLP